MGNIIWSKENCHFCVVAKKLLDAYQIKYEERVLDGHWWSREDLLKLVPDAKTVPQIFMNGKHIGGYEELQQYIEEHGMAMDESISA